MLNGISDNSLQKHCIQALDALEAGRHAVAKATNDERRLDKAIADLEKTFVGLTKEAPRTNKGTCSLGRSLIYEDCTRESETQIGIDVLNSISSALALVLEAARWFTNEVAAGYRKELWLIYNELMQRSHNQAINLADFWPKISAIFSGNEERIIADIQHCFQSKWESILRVDREQRRCQYLSSEIEGLVRKTFSARTCGWISACYHSPDIMIRAASHEDIRNDNYEAVLGELHVGVNTLGTSLFVEHHPDRQALFEAAKVDLSGGRVVPLLPKWLETPARAIPILVSPEDYRLTISSDPQPVDKSKILPLGSLWVEESDSILYVRTRDGKRRYQLIDFLGDMLMTVMANRFYILPSSQHTPRITVDRLVIVREAWTFNLEDVYFSRMNSRHKRFVSAIEWRHRHSIPRFVFAKLSTEKKPIYIDFTSPIYIDLVSRIIRRSLTVNAPSKSITFTEMLPSVNSRWLTDTQGAPYTCEFRFVAYDLNSLKPKGL